MPISGIVDRIVSILAGLVPEDFAGIGSELYSFLPLVVFAVFVYLVYKSLKIAFHGMMVFVAGALFPLFANYFFDAGLAIAIDTMVSYGLLALIAYLGYVFLGTITRVLKIVTWPLRKLFSGSKEKVTRDEVEEIMDEEE